MHRQLPPLFRLSNTFLLVIALAKTWSLSASELKQDERVTFFPTLGVVRPDGLELDLHGWVCEPEPSRVVVPTLCRWLAVQEEGLTREERLRLISRVQWFLADSERGKSIRIRMGDTLYAAGRSAANGHFQNRIRIPRAEAGALSQAGPGAEQPSAHTLHFTAALKPGDSRTFPGRVHVLTDTGLSVVSDIDDTIKISEVQDRGSLLRNTFLHPYKPVDGMAATYQRWASLDQAQFHYVSASPWQLFIPLNEFFQTNQFPGGSLHLKPVRLKDGTFVDLFASPAEHKRKVLLPLMRRFPNRQFVLVGDSGEEDPEIYGDLARRFPRQIRRICVRDVTGQKPEASRYAQAFREVPKTKWQIFQTAAELPEDLSSLRGD